MPVTVPRELGALARKFAALATEKGQERFLKGVARELRTETRKMYQAGTDPFGSAWTRTKDGRQAYQSNKMGNAIVIRPHGPDLEVGYVVKWIRAADEGHTFAARQVAAQSQYLTFDKHGRLVRRERATFAKGVKAGQARRGYSQTFARAHAVGQRVLPPRQQEPHGRMPGPWGDAINRGCETGMREMLLSQSTGDVGR